ncbi:hypothetical protein HKD37_07G019383 [Glycine soja]
MKGKAPMTEISSVEVEKGSKVDREKELRTIQYLQQIGETFVFGGINRIYNMVGKVFGPDAETITRCEFWLVHESTKNT